VAASNIVELGTIVVEVVEYGQAVLAAVAVGLGAPRPGERPGVLASTDALPPPVLPAEVPLVRGDAAAGPEVRRVVGLHLLQEVLDLGGVVHGDHPHPTAGAVLTGLSPREGVTSLPPAEQVVPPLPLVVATPSRALGGGRGRLDGGRRPVHNLVSRAHQLTRGGGAKGRRSRIRGEGRSRSIV